MKLCIHKFIQTVKRGLGSSKSSSFLSSVPHSYANSELFLFQCSRYSVAHNALNKANITKSKSSAP